MTGTGIRVHGGIELQGPDTEISNLEIQQISGDPVGENVDTLWVNTVLNRVSYNETVGDSPIVRRIAHDGDIATLSTQIITVAQNISSATEVAITAAIQAVAQNTVINNTTNNLLFGTPIYFLTDGSIAPAIANNNLSCLVRGFVSSNVILANGGSGQITLVGNISGNASQWGMITNLLGGLIPGSNYFLDIYTGRITITPPTNSGQYLCMLGYASTPTDFVIKIERPILL